jgi:hypothetical protein
MIDLANLRLVFISSLSKEDAKAATLKYLIGCLAQASRSDKEVLLQFFYWNILVIC